MEERRKSRMTGRKVTAFVLMTIIYTGLFVLMVFLTPASLVSNGPIILVLLMVNATVFISFNSLDKWLQTKFFKGE